MRACARCGCDDVFLCPSGRCLACAKAWRAADDAAAEEAEALAAIEPWSPATASEAEQLAMWAEFTAGAESLAQGGAA
jgi:hypothetical protein